MKALSDLVMLDLTHMLSGPYGTMLLSDLGVQTIKVERPGTGEGTRPLLAKDPKNSLNGMGAYFLTLNRNKKSVCIDLRQDEGRELFYRMAEKADIVFDNFSAGVTGRLKIDHAHLSKINPRIITCTLTGFGETGPDKDRPAFDMVAQGLGGGMSITGSPDCAPMRSGIPIGDLGGGAFAAMGVLAALHARTVTGRGQHVDVSMLDGQISLLNYMATMYFLSGDNPGPLGNGHFVHVPYNVFKTKSRPIILACVTDEFAIKVAEILGDADLQDEKYHKQQGRFPDREFINDRVQEHLAKESCEHWMELLTRARIPHAPVNDFEYALNDPQIRARNMVVEVEHPEGGSVEMPGNPIKLSETHEDTFTPPPLVGQHTDEVFRDMLGLDDGELARLRRAEIIG
ncbi:MAG: CoA transferase [Alphaproteobacteria bacterium]|nr:CoA transferase [Alphaproteobacteria bacterium]